MDLNNKILVHPLKKTPPIEISFKVRFYPGDMIEKSDVQICDIQPRTSVDDSWKNSSYYQLIREIETRVKTGGFHIDPNVQQEHRNILRLGIQSLGASHWGELTQTADANLGKFLYSLSSSSSLYNGFGLFNKVCGL